MECPECKLECFINNSNIVVTGDKSIDTETKLFNEFEYVCHNPNCGNFEKIVGTEMEPVNFVSR